MSPKKKARGNFITELVLWMTPIVVAIGFYLHCFSTYGWSFEEFLIYVDEIVSIGSVQPAYLNYDPKLQEIYRLAIMVEWSFGLWFLALIYTLWRFLSKKEVVCTSCGSSNCLVPINTPEGKRIIAEVESMSRLSSEDG